MPLVPREPGRDDWLVEDVVLRLWGVRRAVLTRVADLADVPYELRGGSFRGRGVYGAEPTYPCFPPEDVERVAADLREGRIEVDPSWWPDTSEGREAERRLRRQGWAGDLPFIAFLAVIALFLLAAALFR